MSLEVDAYVRPLISVSPKRLRLEGEKDKTIKGTVRIRAEIERPLTLQVAVFSLPNELTYRLEEIERGKAFDITFSTIPARKDRFRGFLKLQTNYPEKPYVIIYIDG